MKKTTILTILCISFYLTEGQNLPVQYANCNPCNGNNPQYGAPTPFTTDQIVSDYGMRIARPPATRYHQGIDYAGPGAGAGLASLEGGANSPNNDQRATVLGIFNTPKTVNNVITYTKPKYILIEDNHRFAYLHIFENGNAYPIRSGGFVLTTTNNNNLAIINLDLGIALCVNPNEIVTYNGVQYTTDNRVQAGQLIAPIGDSGAMAVHLHLSCLESGTITTSPTESIDPWNFVVHEDNILDTRLRSRGAPNFNTVICEENVGNAAWGTVTPSYGNNTRNVMEVEVSMPNAVMGNPLDRYTNVVMNEDRIDIQMTNALENNFQNIIGSQFNSYFQICFLSSNKN
jgi:hypothetical protein